MFTDNRLPVPLEIRLSTRASIFPFYAVRRIRQVTTGKNLLNESVLQGPPPRREELLLVGKVARVVGVVVVKLAACGGLLRHTAAAVGQTAVRYCCHCCCCCCLCVGASSDDMPRKRQHIHCSPRLSLSRSLSLRVNPASCAIIICSYVIGNVVGRSLRFGKENWTLMFLD